MEDRGDTWKTAAGQESLLSLSLQGSPSPANSFISDTTQHKKSQNISDLKNLQLWWASDVKGHSYDLLLWVCLVDPCMLKKYFFRWWSWRLTLLFVEDDARAALVPWLLKQSLRFFSAFTSARIKLIELWGFFSQDAPSVNALTYSCRTAGPPTPTNDGIKAK